MTCLKGFQNFFHFTANAILTHHRFLWLLCLSIRIIILKVHGVELWIDNCAIVWRRNEKRGVRRSWRQPHLIKLFYDDFPVEQFLRCWLIKERERKIGIQLKHRIHWYSNFTSSLFFTQFIVLYFCERYREI